MQCAGLEKGDELPAGGRVDRQTGGRACASNDERCFSLEAKRKFSQLFGKISHRIVAVVVVAMRDANVTMGDALTHCVNAVVELKMNMNGKI